MTTQLAPNSMSLPPPSSLAFDLLDGNRRVGWISGRTVGFRGFASESEAAHAAWIAYRTLARRLARRHGGRAVPIDVEPLGLRQEADSEVILASNRSIASLLRPGVESRSGPDSFGFEIQVPSVANELSMRSIAYRVYRTLRKSGVRWAMWNKRLAKVVRQGAAPNRQAERVPARRPVENSPSAIAFVSKLILTAIAIVMGAGVIATAPHTVTIPVGIMFAAGLVASGVPTAAQSGFGASKALWTRGALPRSEIATA